MPRPAKSRMARILVIDDDEAVREATAMVLEGSVSRSWLFRTGNPASKPSRQEHSIW